MYGSLIALIEEPQEPREPKPPVDQDDRKKSKVQQKQQKRQIQKKKGQNAEVRRAAEARAKKRARAAEKARKTRAKKAKQQRADAAAENKKKRDERKARLKKKRDADGTRGKSGGASPAGQVPAQIRHCMLALKYKRKKSTKAAWNICRWAMTKYGYLKGPYRINTKLPKATKQTQKGVRRSFQHGMEKGPLNKGIPGTGTTKARKFDKMFKEIEKEVVKKGR